MQLKPLRFYLITALALLALALCPTGAMAQDDSGDDGAGFLTRTIQNALSGGGRTVTITGFNGALSSNATMQKLTIADDEGVWFEMDNATLKWRRSALLLGRLEIDELSAEKVILSRLPESNGEEEEETEAPSPEAKGITIPRLPIAINISNIGIGEFDLGEAVIGEAAVLTMSGRFNLARGALDTALDIQREDQPGVFDVQASYDPSSEELSVNVNVQEEAGGLISTLMDLPGDPSVDLTIQGTGPLDNYNATLDLKTNGEERMTGSLNLRGRDDGGREFALQVNGDLTALAAPDYQEFLGTDITLAATGIRSAEGALDLDLLRFTSAALNVQGSMNLAADGTPDQFDLKGTMVSPTGQERMTLPFGNDISLASANMDIAFDREQSEDVTGTINVVAPQTQGFSADNLELSISGALPDDGKSTVTLGFDATGLNTADPAVNEALGDEITGSADISFGEGPINIRNLVIDGASVDLSGSADYIPAEGEDGEASVELSATADVANLTTFAPLTGMDLAGSAQMTVDFQMQFPSTTMHLTAQGEGQNLSVGIEPVDALLNSPARLELDVERGSEGITLNTLYVGTDAIQLTGEGTLASNSGEIDYDLKMPDVGVLTGTTSGEVDVSGSITQSPTGMTITASGGGDDITTGIEQVDALLAGGLALDVEVDLPKDGPITLETALIQTDELRLSGSGVLSPSDEMDLTFSARLANSALFTGGQAGPLTLAGTAQAADDGGIAIRVAGGGNDIGTGIEPVDNLLRGRTTITANVDILEGTVTINTASIDAPGATIALTGSVASGDVDLNLGLNIPNSAAVLGADAGPIDLDVSLQTAPEGGYHIDVTGNGSDIGIGNDMIDALFAGTTTVGATVRIGPDNTVYLDQLSFSSAAITASGSGSIDETGPQIDFNLRLDDLGRLVGDLSGPLTLSGSLSPSGNGDGSIALNVNMSGPGGTTATVSGTVGHADGSVNLQINGSAPLGLANSFIAPRSLSGMANFALTMNGQPGLESLTGQVTISDGRLVAPNINQVVRSINGTITYANGNATLNISAVPDAGGQITATGTVNSSAPFQADLAVAFNGAVFTEGDFATTTVNGTIAIRGPLTGGGTISGRLGLSNTEVRLVSTGLGGATPIPEIEHYDEPEPSFVTRERAGLVATEDNASSAGGSSSRMTPLNLDITLATDSSIYIRGRGLDAELRGSLTISGTTANPQPVGQFDLVRGRLDLLTKRLNLTEGWIRLAGDFTPELHFVATTSNNGYDFTITIEGSPSDLNVDFASTPSLPEDEIVSELFFGRSTASLTPLQAAQLAAAVATLTGNGNGGLLERLRQSTGLDDLELTTTEDGQTSLTMGRYLTENIYSQTEVDADGQTTFSLNLDLSNNVKAQASVSSDGDSGLGVFFEKNY